MCLADAKAYRAHKHSPEVDGALEDAEAEVRLVEARMADAMLEQLRATEAGVALPGRLSGLTRLTGSPAGRTLVAAGGGMLLLAVAVVLMALVGYLV